MELLTKLGLTTQESKAYISLLKFGTTSVGNIIRDTKIPSSHIYEILERLIAKGLVNYTVRRNVKYFEATDPKGIETLYSQKFEEIQQMKKELPNAITMLQSYVLSNQDKETNITIYEGIRGIRNAIQKVLKVLKNGETYYVLGAPLIGNKKLNAFYKEFHDERIKKRVLFKIIYNKSAESFAKERRKSQLSTIKISDEDSLTEICIYADTVQIIIFATQPILLEIKNAELSKSFKQHFNMAWERSAEI